MFSVFNKPKFDLDGEIQKLQDELVLIAGLKEFLVSKTGVKLLATLSQRITDYNESIVALAEHPEKHADEMRLKHCLGACYSGLISILETTVDQAPDTLAKLTKYKETAQRAELAKR